MLAPAVSRSARLTRLLALVVALSLAAVMASACSPKGSDSSSGPVKIGILWPFSGAYSNYGPDGLAGAKLALEEAGMEVAGRKIELIKANEDVLDPSKTLAEAKRLVQKENVSVILGPVFGSSQQAIASYLKANDVMAFTPYGATKELGGSGNTISWPTLDTKFSSPLGDYMAKTLHYKEIATLAPDYVYGHNVLQGAIEEFTKNGGKVVQQQWIPLGTTDVLPYASHLNTSVDALVMWLVPQDAATFVKGLRSLGVKIPIVFVNGVFDPTFQDMGKQIEGSIGVVDWSAGLTNPENEKFVAAFKKANNGQVPDNSNAAAYVDTKLALAAIEKTDGSTKFADLKDAITSVRLDTPYGPGHIDDQFFGVTDRTIVKATKQGDRYVWAPVKTYENVSNGS